MKSTVKRTKAPNASSPIKRTKKAGQIKKKTGPKVNYRDDMPERAYKLCLLGLNNAALATAFGVSVSTVEYWYRYYFEFMRAVDLGRVNADANVAAALYKRAIGYQEDDLHISVYRGDVIATPIKRNIVPDVTAQQFWLKSRQRDQWGDKAQLDVNNNLSPHVRLDMSVLDEGEIAVLHKLVGIKTDTYDFSDALPQ